MDKLPKLDRTESTPSKSCDRLKVRADVNSAWRIIRNPAYAMRWPRAGVEMGKKKSTVFSARFHVGMQLLTSELEPRLFSFNNPMGACRSAMAWRDQLF